MSLRPSCSSHHRLKRLLLFGCPSRLRSTSERGLAVSIGVTGNRLNGFERRIENTCISVSVVCPSASHKRVICREEKIHICIAIVPSPLLAHGSPACILPICNGQCAPPAETWACLGCNLPRTSSCRSWGHTKGRLQLVCTFGGLVSPGRRVADRERKGVDWSLKPKTRDDEKVGEREDE